MSHSPPPGMKYNRSSLLSLENNYRHVNGGAKTLTIKKLKFVYKIQQLYEFQTLKAPIKLSRKMAIFEFSSSNGFSSFNINFECRSIEIIEDENNNHFSYVVRLPFWSDTSCDERGYKEWDRLYENVSTCITTFQGQKCSMI